MSRDPLYRLKRRTNRLAADGAREKLCCGCGQWFPATAEHFYRKGRYLHSNCRECGRIEAREYQRARYVPRVRTQDATPQDDGGRTLSEVWR